MTTNIILSDRDTKAFEEIKIDKLAAEQSMEISHSLHTNTLASIEKSSQTLWKHIRDTYNLDENLKYGATYSTKDRRIVIIEVSKEKG